MLKQYLPFTCFFIFTVVGAYIAYLNRSHQKNSVVFISLLIYLNCVWWLLFTPGKYPTWDSAHYFFYHSAKIIYKPTAFKQPGAFLNIVMTMPGGFYLAYFFNKRINIFSLLIISIVVGLFNEESQFFLDIFFHINRTVDITDVITNSIGVISGYIFTKYGILNNNKNKFFY